MEKIIIHIILLITLLLTCILNVSNGNIKTFYDTDLETSNFFHDQRNVNQLCDKLGEFYEEKNEILNLPRCIRFKNTMMLYCQGEMENFRNYTNKPKLERIETLIVCYHNSSTFDANLLKYFIKLKNLFIGYSSFNQFINKLPRLESLSFINITRNELMTLKGDFFSDLPSVNTIDLRYNQLQLVEKIQINSNTNSTVQIYLYGNLWNCSQAKIIKWIAGSDLKYDVVDKKKLNCSDHKFRARPLYTVMNFKNSLTKLCKDLKDLRNCTCHISFLRYEEDTRSFKPVASVNCSGKGFYNFPEMLPPYTNTFFIDHNKIRSLDALCFKNSTYNNVHDIYLEYNEIRDVSVLDNCQWFENFRVLNLKGNLIERIPVFAFSNSLELSNHATKLLLSENNWICSCRYAPRLLKLCQKYDLIADKRKIRCRNEKNDPDINGRLLMELTKNDVCKVNQIILNKFEIMSIIFTILIILLLLNLLYDWYRYKSSGKLPWIVLNTPLF
ncbi:hypothetical protein PVAND_009646 [Polypedilum vanderplanki]|uniref:Uncharacterized protein n=1 Tax=Polypedilum vanderplanki TaxID=319348 RepID=A0A9J6CD61_POLVA|nr:hypothetical protein PVAND_009646 [Polypedilum vanderplanki]